MKKIKKSYRLNEETINKIERFATEKKINNTHAIELMIEEFFKGDSKKEQRLINKISDLLDVKLKKMREDIRRIRVTANVIDRDVKMMLEFWNHYFVVNDFNELATTEKFKTDELKEAEELVRRRIAERRQLKYEKNQG